MKSIVQKRDRVSFPAHTGERIYMQSFTKRAGLPAEFRRWQLTVDQMLDGIDTDGPVYLMVDQKRVAGGTVHRRGGLHVDGNWLPGLQAHGQDDDYPHRGHGHPVPAPKPSHVHAAGKHGHIHAGSWDNPSDGRWKNTGYRPEAIILASTVLGARAYAGNFTGPIGSGGECDAIDGSRLSAIDMEPFVAWAGNVTMIHESLPVASDTLRTVVRLNVPGWQPEVM